MAEVCFMFETGLSFLVTVSLSVTVLKGDSEFLGILLTSSDDHSPRTQGVLAGFLNFLLHSQLLSVLLS